MLSVLKIEKDLKKLKVGALYVIADDSDWVLGCYRGEYDGLPWFTPLAWIGNDWEPCYLAGVCAGRRARVISVERSARYPVSLGLPVRDAIPCLVAGVER